MPETRDLDTELDHLRQAFADASVVLDVLITMRRRADRMRQPLSDELRGVSEAIARVLPLLSAP